MTRIVTIGRGLLAALMALTLAHQAFAQTRQVKMRLDWVPTGMYSAFYYGQQRGYYAKEGMSLEILPGAGSNATMDGLLRGDLDVGFVSCWGMAVGIGQGRDVISVATFTGKNGFAFFYPAESNVQSLNDLAGKTIVVSPASFDTLLYPAVLASVGLPPDLMRRVNVDPAQKVSTFIRGQADVVVTHYAGSYPPIEAQRKVRYTPWSSTGFVLPDFCLAVTRQRLEKEPEFVEKFLHATYAATRDAAAKPADAATASVEYVPLLDRAMTEKQWRLMTELFFTEDTKSCPHGWHSASDWAKALETLKKFGNLQGDIADHNRFYTNRFFPCKR